VSTYVFGFFVVAAVGAEVYYAAADLPDLQGRAFGALLFLAVGFALYRAVTRNKYSRPCPRCGLSVSNGVLNCRACGFDFRTVGDARDEASLHRPGG
jgi:hypothetical protein